MTKLNLWGVAAFSLPLYSLSANLGIQLSTYKILPFVVFVIAIFNMRYKTAITPPALLSVLLMYVVLNTLLNYIGNINYEFDYAIDNGWNIFRVYSHMPIQLILLIFSLMQFFALPYIVKQRFNYNSFISGFINGNLFSLSIGFGFLSLAWLGIDIVSTNYLDGDVQRLSGLGGEPRHFSALIVLALAIMLSDKDNHILCVKRRKIKMFVLLFGLLLSLSTSSIIALVLVLVSMFLIRGINMKKTLQVILALTSFAILWSSELVELLNRRILDRMVDIDTFLYFAPKDALALYFLKDNFESLLFGVGSGGITFHTMQVSFLNSVGNDLVLNTEIMQNVYRGEIAGSLSPSSFSIKFIAEHGLVGFILLTLFFRGVVRTMKNTPYYSFSTALSLAVLAISFVASALVVYIYVTTISILYAKLQDERVIDKYAINSNTGS